MDYQELLHILYTDISPKEMADKIFILSLKPQQRLIFDLLPEGSENPISSYGISIYANIPTKNVSTQLRQLAQKYPIRYVKDRYGRSYYKDTPK